MAGRLLLIFACLVGTSWQFALPKPKPNVIFILADDLGWNDVGFHGNNYVSTPNIDALAYSGIILNQHYVAPLCSPTRASLLTGRFPTSNGMWQRVMNATQPYGLHIQEKLMPQYFKDHGYSTHMIGKWHLGFYRMKYTPMYRGFDTYFGHLNSRIDYYNHSHLSVETIQGSTLRGMGYDLYEGNYSSPLLTGQYITRVYTERVQELIEKHDTSNPFLLYLPYTSAHLSNPTTFQQAPPETIAKFSYIANPQRRVQSAVIYEMDISIGHIVQALKNRDMLENNVGRRRPLLILDLESSAERHVRHVCRTN
ncbi:hypothetical protein B566_EDAN007505 [Ephemera danica]|nr:hypothetical protein B566_EDAN007505 [Ephemera danica]